MNSTGKTPTDAVDEPPESWLLLNDAEVDAWPLGPLTKAPVMYLEDLVRYQEMVRRLDSKLGASSGIKAAAATATRGSKKRPAPR